MRTAYSARLLRIHISEGDRYQGKPLHEAIVARCRELRIAGATVFRGSEGFGETAVMHRSGLVRHDLPVLIVVVDTPENLDRLIPAVEEMMHTGLMAFSDVEAVRLRKPPQAQP